MRVLIASDLSDASDCAVQQGVLMAGGARVALCHVMPELGTHALLPQDYEADIDGQVAMQPRVVDALLAQWARLVPHAEQPPEVFVELGSAQERILRRATDWQAELIAVGTHGRVGLKRLLLGSVAAQVVRAAHCPVLVARAAREGAVLVATDLTDSAMPAVAAGAAEAARRGSRLVVMHALETSAEASAAMGLLGALPAVETPETLGARRALVSQIIDTTLTRLQAQAEIVIADEDVVQETLRLAEALPAAIIVVGTHGRKSLSRLVLGSKASALIERAACSVLVTRQANSSGEHSMDEAV